MGPLLSRIERYAVQRPHAPALDDERTALTYGELCRAVHETAARLPVGRVGLLLGNGIPWAVCDLAVHLRGAVCVPLPTFFSDRQLEHVVADAGLDCIITDQPVRGIELVRRESDLDFSVADRRLYGFRIRRGNGSDLPGGTGKITYTSGTTGAPKGVCLAGHSLQNITESLCAAVDAGSGDRTLSLLPLSTLLENIAGLYAPLWAGAHAHVPALAACGSVGPAGPNPARLIRTLAEVRPTSLVLVPALLKLLVETVAAGAPMPPDLRFIAVGGAPVAAALLDRARSLGLPVYQGYGLSEAASVVSLNLPGADRPASVGRPLPHAGVRIAADGEVCVRGETFRGYVGSPGMEAVEVRTGDLGYLDADGFLHLTGRKKTAFATAYGRNVAPEWVESELTGHPAVIQGAVFGEGRPFNVAVLVPNPSRPGDLPAAVAATNRRLPDYARVRRWVVADEPFTAANGLARGAGAVDRDAVAMRYRTEIESLYEDNHVKHVL
jgi:long-subunit acyl-CoA synthetase (AMP-forming)